MKTVTKVSQAEIVSMLIDTQGYDKEEATEIAESVDYSLRDLADEYFPSDNESPDTQSSLEQMKEYLGINKCAT